MSNFAFRSKFKLIHKEAIRWFPGHMTKGLRQMQQKLKNVDCIIEVHDSRLPISGRNPDFKHTISGLKPHILVLNKKDLGDSRTYHGVAEQIKHDENIDHILFTNCKDHTCPGVRKIVPLAKELILNSNRYNRTDEKDYCMMVIGVPNVGKSSLVNVLRNYHLKKKNASAVGAVAGMTKSVLNKIKINEDPQIFLLDTPGIMTPKVESVETGLKLALCSCFKDHLVGEDIIADFLLYLLNKRGLFDYVPLMGLKEPTDEIAEVLVAGAVKLGKTKKLKHFDGTMVVRPDIEAAAVYMIKLFRSGELGKFNLDDNSWNS